MNIYLFQDSPVGIGAGPPRVHGRGPVQGVHQPTGLLRPRELRQVPPGPHLLRPQISKFGRVQERTPVSQAILEGPV